MEVYEPAKNQWKLLDLSLPFDYFNHAIVSVEKDKVLIVAGFNSNSDLKNVHEIDLKEKTILNKCKLSNKRISFNMFHDKKRQKLFIIGGKYNFHVNIGYEEEEIDLKTFQVSTFNLYLKKSQVIETEMFCSNHRQVHVETESRILKSGRDPMENLNKFTSFDSIKKTNYIFGTDNEPFILKIH